MVFNALHPGSVMRNRRIFSHRSFAVSMLVITAMATGAAGTAQARSDVVPPPLDAAGDAGLNNAGLGGQVVRMAADIGDLRQEIGMIQLAQTPQPLLGGSGSGGRIDVQSLPSDYASSVENRLQAMERELSRLTGAVEEQRFRNDQLAARLERAINDIEFRLSELEAAPPSASGPMAPGGAVLAPAANAPESGAPIAPPVAPPVTVAVPETPSSGDAPRVVDGGGSLQDTVRTLGTVPLTGGRPTPPSAPDSSSSGNASGVAPSTGSATVMDRPQLSTAASASATDPNVNAAYNDAYGLLTRGQYADSEAAFSAFIDRYPDHVLAENAQYWLGETFYIRGQYTEAARTFASAYRQAQNGAKAPDNLLKLGLSLSALNQTADACTAFQQVVTGFSDAPAAITDRARQELSRLGC